MRQEYMPVGTPDERAVARDFVLEYAAAGAWRVAEMLERWDWFITPPCWVRVEPGGDAHFVW